jgi:DNA-binding transcriptional ArsR family regulator
MSSVVATSETDRQRAAAIGRALSDPKRLCVLEALSEGELSVGDLSTAARCQVPNMSQHLSVLRAAGLVTSRREGSTVYYRLSDPRVIEAYALIQNIAR